MTDKQIKQKAEIYATERYGEYDEHDYTDHSRNNLCHAVSEEAFIVGAHSRDKEVKMLQNQIEELSEQLKMNAENIQKLCNPWHKTDDDSPKEGVHYKMKDGVFLYGKPMLLHICEDDDDSGDDYKGYFDGKFWRYWDKPMCCDVVRGKVTHWMSIPELSTTNN